MSALQLGSGDLTERLVLRTQKLMSSNYYQRTRRRLVAEKLNSLRFANVTGTLPEKISFAMKTGALRDFPR
jgi:hypothetical protein